MAIPQSRRLDFTEIPVIDLSRLVAGEEDASTVESIGAACRNVGFLYISNHGIEQILIDNVLAAAREFFAQPEEEKKRILLDERIRGYLPIGYHSYEGEPIAASHQSEGFWIGEERSLHPDNKLDGPNLWPQNCPALRDALTVYFTAVKKLAVVLQRAFSLALGREETFFETLFEYSTSSILLNHYPPQHSPQSVNRIGLAPHTDDGGFTILWQDDSGGLEIQSKSGEWVVAPPLLDTFVINLGDVMQIWTNGEFSSTPHRVINRSGVDRYSIPCFVNPRWDVPVAPLTDDVILDVDAELYGVYQRNSWRRTFPIAQIPE